MDTDSYNHVAYAALAIWFPIVIAMFALCLHLDHGIWSALQTLGWTTRGNTRGLRTLSRIIALIVFLGFTSVPVAVLAGWLR